MTAENPIPYSSPISSTDNDQLRLLSVFHYVVAGLTALFGCFPFIHLFIGIAFLSGWIHDDHGATAPRFIGVIFIAIASIVILLFWTLAVLIFLAGRSLGRRRRHTFCFVIACLECFFMPFGTVLGVFTIIVLMRAPVKESFGLAV